MAPDNPGHPGPDPGRGAHASDDELLVWLADATAADMAERAGHLAECPSCQQRAQALRSAERRLQAMAVNESWAGEAQHARARARLQDRLAAVDRGVAWAPWLSSLSSLPALSWLWPRSSLSIRPLTSLSRPLTAGLTALVVVAAGAAWIAGGAGSRWWVAEPSGASPPLARAAAANGAVAYDRVLPIRSLTPGATVALAAEELCRQGPWEPSPIPEPVRDSVLRAYGMEAVPGHEYELDYLITPDLGGSPDPRNLWPEPYASPVWNAKVKDELESLLPRLVCDGHVDLATAQREIAADWVAAYKKYFKTDRPIRRS
jgi:hypothetical protein